MTRGGLVPAAIVARELGCRLVETVCVASYDEEVRGVPSVLKLAAAAGDGAGFVVIDDLVDHGETARVVRGMLPAAHFACLYAKPAGRSGADTVVAEVAQDVWVVFPWDSPPSPG